MVKTMNRDALIFACAPPRLRRGKKSEKLRTKLRRKTCKKVQESLVIARLSCTL